jgi:sugar lactone lactonase YvrE
MKTIRSVECVLATANMLGEVPLWDAAASKLWWCDVKEPALVEHDVRTKDWHTHRLEGQTVGSWAFARSGGALLAQEDGLYRWTPDGGRRLFAPIVRPRPDQRLNDGRCDRKGRFWVGSMSQGYRDTPVGVFHRVDPDGTVTRAFDGFTVPNSVAFSPDDKRMYFADTSARRIFVFDFDLEDGALSGQRIFHDCGPGTGGPDGSTVDVDGCLWNTDYKGSRVVRYTPRGEVDTVLELPVSQPTSCTFGGPNLDTLYITTARQNLTQEQLREQPLAGHLFAVRPGTQGLEEPKFSD